MNDKIKKFIEKCGNYKQDYSLINDGDVLLVRNLAAESGVEMTPDEVRLYAELIATAQKIAKSGDDWKIS